MGSRRRAARFSVEDCISTGISGPNGFSVSKSEETNDRYTADNLASRSRRPSQIASPRHPALTDFGPASLSKYLEDEFAKLKQLASRFGHQQEEELREFARSLVNSKNTVYETRNGSRKSFNVSSHGELASPADVLTSEKGKKPLRKENERTGEAHSQTISSGLPQEFAHDSASRSLRSSTKQSAATTQAVPSPISALPVETLDAPLTYSSRKFETSQRRSRKNRSSATSYDHFADDFMLSTVDHSPNAVQSTNSTRLRLSRTSSFENHASQSRDTSRYDDRSANSSTTQSDSRRRRKTPVPTQSFLSHSVWSSTQHQAEPTVSSNDEFTDSWQDLTPYRTNDHVFYDTQADIPDLLFSRDMDDCFNIAMTDTDSDEDLDAQKAIMASIKENTSHQPTAKPSMKFSGSIKFDYGKVVPEDVPTDVQQARVNRCTIWQAHGFDRNGKLSSNLEGTEEAGPFANDQLDPAKLNWLGALDAYGDYPRTISPRETRASLPEIRRRAVAPRGGLPFQIWEADTGKSPGGVLHYLSSTEIRNLRLVCKSLAEDLEPYVFRNVVTHFSPQLFNINPTYLEDGRLNLEPSASMMHRFGSEINKFGISFDYDVSGLANAPFKTTETVVDAWFGRYTWPVRDYPYFGQLREVDKLLDDERRLLTHALRNLKNCRELAISLDSGHGWLSGPDMSDLALYREQAAGGSKVFGRTYDATDRKFDVGLKQLFKWAQLNTLNENIKSLDGRSNMSQEECNRLRAITIRDYDTFREERKQPDFTATLHTGGVAGLDQWNQAQAQAQAQAHIVPNVTNLVVPVLPFIANNSTQGRFAAVMGLVQANVNTTMEQNKDDKQEKNKQIEPQWPIIFNGHNVSAESRGDSAQVQGRIANPVNYPLLPSSLTEPQAQWLMETSWIQKSFLSAYMDAVRLNVFTLRNVHSLHLSKISSGLLPQLLQKEFWSCLRGLRKITLLVKPDWRVEHTTGDKFYQTNMAAEPITAAYKFADVLKDCIAPLEHLNSLHIGYLGGGEHQTGIFGRNQHILPAPVTQTPRSWLIAQNSSNAKPHSNTIIVFPHVRTLRFENCWFSPLMLEEFMVKSRDTSLHNLILDSVSLTTQVNSTRTDGPLRTADHHLKCQYGVSSWLSETLPVGAAWSNVLGTITPGTTLLDRKYDEGMIDEEESPRPGRTFRGNVQQITLKSCGYVKILGIPSNELNQNELVYQHTMWSAMDDGLKLHANKFTQSVPGENLHEATSSDAYRAAVNPISATLPNGTPAGRALLRAHQKELVPRTVQRPIMLSGRPAHMRSETIYTHDENNGVAALTGYLTQCMHPIEKRVLEQHWGMEFGWGDDMRRWEAVEDGWFMGGTGRFSGDIFKDHTLQQNVPIPTEEGQSQSGDDQHDAETGSNAEDAGAENETQQSNTVVQPGLSSQSLPIPEPVDTSNDSEDDDIELSRPSANSISEMRRRRRYLGGSQSRTWD